MVGHEIPLVLCGLVSGFVLGVLAVKKLQRVLGGHRNGRCADCGTAGFVVVCERCRRAVAMCHYYNVLLPDKPDPARLRPRRHRQFCTNCASAQEIRVLEGIS